MKKMMDESCARRRERGRARDGRGQRGGTHGVHEEPVLVDGVGVEEELGALERLREEVAREERDPLEDREARAGLEHEHGDRLLREQAHDDRRPAPPLSALCQARRRGVRRDAPWDVAAVLGRRPEAELEDEEAEDGDRTVAVARVLQKAESDARAARSTRVRQRPERADGGTGGLTPVSLKKNHALQNRAAGQPRAAPDAHGARARTSP